MRFLCCGFSSTAEEFFAFLVWTDIENKTTNFSHFFCVRWKAAHDLFLKKHFIKELEFFPKDRISAETYDAVSAIVSRPGVRFLDSDFPQNMEW